MTSTPTRTRRKPGPYQSFVLGVSHERPYFDQFAGPATERAATAIAQWPPPRCATCRTALRLWPALIFIALQWTGLLVPRLVAPGTMYQFYGMMLGPLVGTVGLLLWWLFASRIRWWDRLLGLVAFAAVAAIAYSFFDPSMNMFGVFFVVLPIATTVLIGWLFITPFLSWRVRRVGLLVLLVLTWGYHTQVRFDGVTGTFSSVLTYRWTETAAEKHQADVAAGKFGTAAVAAAPAAKPLVLQAGDWPGFRGPNRDSKLTGVKIDTDWAKNPPKLIWRHRVGPGWSSFTVVGKNLFTQEQLDKEELVICYDADTGNIVWTHKDDANFVESVGGPGPRATPTFHEGKLYVQGATGILNCLDAANGYKIWSRDIKEDSGAKLPIWGFASSPLVVQNVVTVFAGGPDGKSVVGYQAKSGEKAWQAGKGLLSYCSPQPAKLGGVEQVLLATELGLTAFQPSSGEIVWNHAWVTDGIQRVVQPAILSDSDVPLGTPFGKGTQRVHVGKQDAGWEATEIWSSRAISPYFNDLVVQGKYLYGFDGNFLTCVNIEDGKKKWRERGYGSGQVLLLEDQKLLLVVSETGAVALVEANPDECKEIAQFQAIEGKTWNHPVVAHGRLYVRNSEEAACYQLTEIGAGK